MAVKSEVIVLDVLHKNETKSSDLVHIMSVMASYLGASYSHVAITGGGGLTTSLANENRVPRVM